MKTVLDPSPTGAPRAGRSVRRLAAAAVLAALALAAAPARAQPAPDAPRGLPSLGDAGEMTPLEERKLGDLIARELYRDPDYIDDAVVGEYVDGIWRALMVGARARGELPPELDERYAWRVLLGRDRSVNAFALPGGYMGLHLGLVGAVASRDELASVLGHEMSHITQRHIARLLGQQSRQMPLLIAAMVAGAVAASRNPQAGAALAVGGQAAVIQQQLNFSRDMEREADRVGYAVMTQAGFAPQGFVSMFEKLQAAARVDDNGEWPYLRSHPLTTQRIADMQQRVQALKHAAEPPPGRPKAASAPSGGSAAGAAAQRGGQDLEALLVAARARVLSRPGVDALRTWADEPGQSGFASQPLARRAGVLYAAALAQVELRDLPRAQALAAQLLPLVAGHPRATHQVQLLQAELALRADQPQRALDLLKAEAPATTSDPRGQAGRAALLLRAQALTRTGQAGEAASQLRTWVGDHPLDASAWQALAQAEAAQGQTLRALRAEGEAPMAQLDYAGAVNRWRAAQDWARQHPGGSAELIEVSIVDARLRQAQALLHQQREDEKKFR